MLFDVCEMMWWFCCMTCEIDEIFPLGQDKYRLVFVGCSGEAAKRVWVDIDYIILVDQVHRVVAVVVGGWFVLIASDLIDDRAKKWTVWKIGHGQTG